MDRKKLMDDIAGLNSENDLLRKLLADMEIERLMLKVKLEYAVADIPHTCQFCMSKRCPTIANDCVGCEGGNHWHWYGAIEV